VQSLTLTAAAVARVTGGQVIQGDPETPIDSISIDSRTLRPGQFFVAIRGERFDGHRFVPDALARGAAGAMIGAPLEPAGGSPGRAAAILRVSDTTRGLQALARDVRRRSGTRVVAITGSTGKTTTKEITAEFLAGRYRVFRNRGNLNHHIGLPLSLFELRSQPEIAVVELGMNHPGEIRTLVGIAEPDVRVWTNVGDAHLGFFASADAIADAKAEILEQAGPGDVLIANADDSRVMSRARGFAGRIVTFGIDTSADVRAHEVQMKGLDGTAAKVSTPAGEILLQTPLLGRGNLANVLAAAATALQFGVPLEVIRERASRLAPAAHRGELLRLPGGITLIDDSYNSSPAALTQALEVVAAAQGCARKIAVLGEMLELGAHAERLHKECGAAAARAGLSILIAVGGAPARALAEAAVAGGIPAECVHYVAANQDAAVLALERVRPGDLVLVKGSRSIGTDLVVEQLRREFA
jgi:UDP-N-acetylmuramoyl-tripeptide--D-alanyl-D-alanine ligase